MRQRRRVRGLKAERADVILAGAVVIEELMALGGYEILTVCDEGVRHGLLLQETFRRGVDRVNSDAFVNRELSWLEFDRRVLEEAEDSTVPLLERIKFLAIVSSNLDEFFMVRVAGLKRRIRENDGTTGPDGLTAAQTLAAVAERAREPERRAAPVLPRSAGAAAGRRGDPPAERGGAHAGAGEVPRRLLPSDRLARRHAACDRSRAIPFPISATARSA